MTPGIAGIVLSGYLLSQTLLTFILYRRAWFKQMTTTKIVVTIILYIIPFNIISIAAGWGLLSAVASIMDSFHI